MKDGTINILISQFQEDSFRHLGKDKAFVFVTYQSTESYQFYGSFQSIKRVWLCGRVYELSLDFTGCVIVNISDSKYNPINRQHELHINPKFWT